MPRLLFAAALAALAPLPLAAAETFNVVVVVLDDAGERDFGCYGSTYHKTPNVDKFAAGAVRFNEATAASPVCSPSRVAILTGRHPAHFGPTNFLGAPRSLSWHRLLGPPNPPNLPLAANTSGERFKAAGYRTGYFGKWHLGGDGFGPTDQGFDAAKGIKGGGATGTHFAPYGRGLSEFNPAPAGESLIDRLTDEAIAFIKADGGQPFFVQLAHYAPHIPLQAKPEVVAKYTEGKPGEQGNPVYAAMLEGIDDSFGRLLKTLDDLKLADSTVVVFTSDHGGVATLEGNLKDPPTYNMELREGKGHLYEGGLRVPLIVRVPGVPAAVKDGPVSLLDLVPTLCDLCGIAADLKEFDGVSLVGTLKGGDVPARSLFWYYPHYANQHNRPGVAVRRGDWKLVVDAETGREELYHLSADPSEGRNAAPENPSLTRELRAELDAWLKSENVSLPPPNPDFVPNPANKNGVITMPAKLAVVSGTQLRFEPLPHKWTLGYWTELKDTASFDFTAASAGKYEVELFVGCSKASAGSRVEVQVGDQTLTFTVPDTGGFQQFEKQAVGTVTLARAGRHTLTVKPLTKPGPAVMDLREVVLRPAK